MITKLYKYLKDNSIKKIHKTLNILHNLVIKLKNVIYLEFLVVIWSEFN